MSTQTKDSFFESKLTDVLNVINRYMPPDGISAHEALTQIIGIVDPWPVKTASAAINLPDPHGYLCDWGDTRDGTTRQTFYYSEPGSASEDDWNEFPKVADNLPMYTAEQVREAIRASATSAPEQKPIMRQPFSYEQDSALCEANCNAESDAFFAARPALDSDANRRIFYAGHRRAWISYPAASAIAQPATPQPAEGV